MLAAHISRNFRLICNDKKSDGIGHCELKTLLTKQRGRNPCELKMGVANSILRADSGRTDFLGRRIFFCGFCRRSFLLISMVCDLRFGALSSEAILTSGTLALKAESKSPFTRPGVLQQRLSNHLRQKTLENRGEEP